MHAKRSKHSKTAPQNNKKSRPAKRRSKRSDDLVEQSLYRLATGYTYIKTEIRVVKGEPKMFRYPVHVPPDVNAIKFLLVNRQVGRWKHPKPTQIKNTTDDDPFLEYLKTLNGKVYRPVENPPKDDSALD